MPIQRRPRLCAATTDVPHPQNGSSTRSPGLLDALMIRSTQRDRLLRRISQTLRLPSPNRRHPVAVLQPVVLGDLPAPAVVLHGLRRELAANPAPGTSLGVLDVELLVWDADRIEVEGRPIAAGVEEQGVVLAGEPARRAPGARVAPGDLVAELPRAEDRVHEHLEVVTRGRVAVQVDAAGRLEHTSHLDQPQPHVAEVGQHPRLAEDLPQADRHGVERMTHGPLDVPHAVGGPTVPLPRVDEAPDLGGSAVLPAEDDVVVGVAVERRVEVDEVHRLSRPLTHPVQAIAVVEGVVLHARAPSNRASALATQAPRQAMLLAGQPTFPWRCVASTPVP